MGGGIASGASSVPDFPRDYRVDRTQRFAELADEDLKKLYQIFRKFDRSASGWLTADDFFVKMLEIRRGVLTEAFYDFFETSQDNLLTWGEFVECVTTFALFEVMDMIKYCFFILNREKLGWVDKNECRHFIMTIWHHELSQNINLSLEYIDEELDEGDGRINFKDFMKLHRKYPQTFYPAFELQLQIMRATMGEGFWENRKAALKDGAMEKEAAEKARLRQAALDAKKANESQNEIMVKKRMGVRYWIMPWAREAERKKVAKIMAITSDLDAKSGETKQ